MADKEEYSRVYSTFPFTDEEGIYKKPVIDIRRPLAQIGDQNVYQVSVVGVPSRVFADQKLIASDPDARSIMVDRIISRLPKEISEKYIIQGGGVLSIDINLASINKSISLSNFIDSLSVPAEKVLYFGDEFIPGGNDLAVIDVIGPSFIGINPNQLEIPEGVLRGGSGVRSTRMWVREILKEYRKLSHSGESIDSTIPNIIAEIKRRQEAPLDIYKEELSGIWAKGETFKHTGIDEKKLSYGIRRVYNAQDQIVPNYSTSLVYLVKNYPKLLENLKTLKRNLANALPDDLRGKIHFMVDNTLHFTVVRLVGASKEPLPQKTLDFVQSIASQYVSSFPLSLIHI